MRTISVTKDTNDTIGPVQAMADDTAVWGDPELFAADMTKAIHDESDLRWLSSYPHPLLPHAHISLTLSTPINLRPPARPQPQLHSSRLVTITHRSTSPPTRARALQWPE
jgi:hypothetical protein